MADVRTFNAGNWQTFGTVWEDKTVVVVDADWANDDSPIVMAAVMKAETTVGELRKQLELPHGTDLNTAQALAYPQVMYFLSQIASGDKDANEQYGIMIGACIRDAARAAKPVSRDLDKIHREAFDIDAGRGIPSREKTEKAQT